MWRDQTLLTAVHRAWTLIPTTNEQDSGKAEWHESALACQGAGMYKQAMSPRNYEMRAVERDKSLLIGDMDRGSEGQAIPWTMHQQCI